MWNWESTNRLAGERVDLSIGSIYQMEGLTGVYLRLAKLPPEDGLKLGRSGIVPKRSLGIVLLGILQGIFQGLF